MKNVRSYNGSDEELVGEISADMPELSELLGSVCRRLDESLAENGGSR